MSASTQDKGDVDSLRGRVEYLEYITSSSKKSEASLNDQVDDLQKVVDALFEKHEPVSNLNSLLYELDLWKHLGDLQALNDVAKKGHEERKDQSSHTQTNTNTKATETAKETETVVGMLSASSDNADNVGNDPNELKDVSNTDAPRLTLEQKRELLDVQITALNKIVSIGDAIMKDFPDPELSSRVAVLSAEAQNYSREIQKISDRLDELSVRSAQTEMLYLKELVNKSNEMWLQFDRMLTKMETDLSELKKKNHVT